MLHENYSDFWKPVLKNTDNKHQKKLLEEDSKERTGWERRKLYWIWGGSFNNADKNGQKHVYEMGNAFYDCDVLHELKNGYSADRAQTSRKAELNINTFCKF